MQTEWREKEQALVTQMQRKEHHYEERQRTLLQLSQDELLKQKREAESRYSTLVQQFKQDMQVVDSEVQAQKQSFLQQN